MMGFVDEARDDLCTHKSALVIVKWKMTALQNRTHFEAFRDINIFIHTWEGKILMMEARCEEGKRILKSQLKITTVKKKNVELAKMVGWEMKNFFFTMKCYRKAQ